ncbi:phosphoadenylyl-sulfate reductase [Candidatus Mycobacterium methanotrophicum]|uniref:Phosphoadenosine 5'-phosphosulfate reductase n=1 Tax=Candidatus Mycobacterium methanotrophicum TaxID=2943498 RepID=A0ABY4QM52_9MYCO|nr:phosphoadenylyl-sulfate reductase [Candidatus Mycobacterium methanotrophicum]UQX11954.1 phosphoadenylyl-sulfate reductase [Candidatus Mycobacterium methanotrophicum]
MSGEDDLLTEAQFRELAARGAAELDGAGATELLGWTDRTFPGKWVVACNMQDAVLVDLAATVRPGVPVIFIDTGNEFPETIGMRDAVAATYDIRLITITPEPSVLELGTSLCYTDPGECCRLRKVVPLAKALPEYCAWVTGLRRADASTRSDAPLVSFDEKFKLVKVNPLAAWSDQDMTDYITQHNVLVNPLVHEGYPSIGCAPNTTKPAPGADKRSGRFAGFNKTECGLHVTSPRLRPAGPDVRHTGGL